MAIFKIKRGNYNNLPLLAEGEPAFVLDKKKLFIGNGTENFEFTPVNKNLLDNSNFQYPVTSTDIGNPKKLVIAPNSGAYLFGNYYIYNDASATGSITVTKPADGTGRLILNCVNANPILEYRIKLPRYFDGTSYNYFSSLNNTICTIGYDVYLPAEIGNINAKSGIPSDLKIVPIPTGLNRVSATFTYANTTLPTKSYPCMDIIIMNTSKNITGTIEIGNVKLEQGKLATPYFPNTLIEDSILANISYKLYSHHIRVSIITTNTLEFYIPNLTPENYIYDTKLSISSCILFNLYNITESGFTFTVGLNTTLNLIKIVATKNNHGMRDGTLDVTIVYDNRP